MKEVILWLYSITKPYLVYFSTFFRVFLIDKDSARNYWNSGKKVLWKIQYLKLIPLVFEYDKLIEEYAAVKDRFIFIDNKIWEDQINSLDRSKKYCIFCNNKNNEPYYEYLISQGFKIIKITR